MKNADSIKARLRNLAENENKPFDYLLMHYFIERLLFRLSISEYSDNFILKGGLLLYAMLDNDARATRDIDFLARQIENAPEELVRIFSIICSIDTDDAINFDTSTITAQRIKEDADYEGVRIKLTAFLDKSRQILQFDVGYGDIIVPQPLEVEYPSLLDMERPRLTAYSKESVIAEKFEAMLALAEVNSRMKDFYDIYTLCHTYSFDGGILYEAIRQTLERRNTSLSDAPTVFTEAFAQDKSKQTQWAAFQRRIHVAQNVDYEDVIAAIRVFLSPIYACIISRSAFSGNWDPSSGKGWMS